LSASRSGWLAEHRETARTNAIIWRIPQDRDQPARRAGEARRRDPRRATDGQITSSSQKQCQSPSRKRFYFRFSENHDCIARSRLGKRGVTANRHQTWSAGCDGRFGLTRRVKPARTVKSCGPDSPTLESSLAVMMIRRATAAREPGTPRRARISRKPSRRECRNVRPTCGDCRLLSLLQAGHGCGLHPAFPAPLSFRGHHWSNSGKSCRGNADPCQRRSPADRCAACIDRYTIRNGACLFRARPLVLQSRQKAATPGGWHASCAVHYLRRTSSGWIVSPGWASVSSNRLKEIGIQGE
jgi:hypothetical protein